MVYAYRVRVKRRVVCLQVRHTTAQITELINENAFTASAKAIKE